MLGTMNNRQTALEYAAKGWSVMPLKASKKDPHFDLIKGAYLGATTDAELINFWFDVDPSANVGIACISSDLVVFDVDFRNGGRYIEEMGETYTVKTGDGFHYYYKVSQSASFKGALGDGIDIKHKGYVVAAPSIHPNGSIYTVVNNIEPITIPEALLEMGAK
jgi:hypothetical protein